MPGDIKAFSGDVRLGSYFPCGADMPVLHNEPTGRRRIVDGRMHCELRRADGSTFWPCCRPHDDCRGCAELRAHICPEGGVMAATFETHI